MCPCKCFAITLVGLRSTYSSRDMISHESLQWAEKHFGSNRGDRTKLYDLISSNIWITWNVGPDTDSIIAFVSFVAISFLSLFAVNFHPINVGITSIFDEYSKFLPCSLYDGPLWQLLDCHVFIVRLNISPQIPSLPINRSVS